MLSEGITVFSEHYQIGEFSEVLSIYESNLIYCRLSEAVAASSGIK
jgi:hypothetical protein